MPSSAVYRFTNSDDYAAKIRNTRAEIVVTGRGQFTARIIRIDLHRLWMQRFSDDLPRVGHSAGTSNRTTISFRTEPGPSLFWGAAEMLPTNIVRHALGESTFQRSSGSASWGAMSLPVTDAVPLGETFAGFDLTPPRTALLCTPGGSAMAKLQRLHAAAGRLAEDAPEIIAHPEAARGLEQALIEAMVNCLATGEVRENTLAQGQHAVVMRRFRRVVEENPEHPLYIPEICRAIGVSSRTLQACCHEHLGMGPKHYLLLRRMNLARRALRQSEPENPSVTEIATRFGFWQLGRFAVEYQSLFGESPSTTLCRPPE
jgi:AraC-like DNA-binding protein